MRIVGVQEATTSADCIVPSCPHEAQRNGRCTAHNSIQETLESSWLSDRRPMKETPPMTRVSANDLTEEFDDAVAMIRDFKVRIGRWPVPADVDDFPVELPSRFLPWDGGWQTLWDAVGAGPMPKGRGISAYRSKKNETVVEAPPVAVEEQEDPPEAAVSASPEPEPDTPTDDILDLINLDEEPKGDLDGLDPAPADQQLKAYDHHRDLAAAERAAHTALTTTYDPAETQAVVESAPTFAALAADVEDAHALLVVARQKFDAAVARFYQHDIHQVLLAYMDE